MFTIYIISLLTLVVLLSWDEISCYGVLPLSVAVRILVVSLIPAFNTIVLGMFIFDYYTRYRRLQ